MRRHGEARAAEHVAAGPGRGGSATRAALKQRSESNESTHAHESAHAHARRMSAGRRQRRAESGQGRRAQGHLLSYDQSVSQRGETLACAIDAEAAAVRQLRFDRVRAFLEGERQQRAAQHRQTLARERMAASMAVEERLLALHRGEAAAAAARAMARMRQEMSFERATEMSFERASERPPSERAASSASPGSRPGSAPVSPEPPPEPPPEPFSPEPFSPEPPPEPIPEPAPEISLDLVAERLRLGAAVTLDLDGHDYVFSVSRPAGLAGGWQMGHGVDHQLNWQREDDLTADAFHVALSEVLAAPPSAPHLGVGTAANCSLLLPSNRQVDHVAEGSGYRRLRLVPVDPAAAALTLLFRHPAEYEAFRDGLRLLHRQLLEYPGHAGQEEQLEVKPSIWVPLSPRSHSDSRMKPHGGAGAGGGGGQLLGRGGDGLL